MTSNFIRVSAGADVRHLLYSLSRQPEIWNEITARQSFEDSPHKDTECIFLRWASDPNPEAAFTDLVAVDYLALRKLPEFRSAVSQVYSEVQGTKLGRAILVKLKPGGVIIPHADEGAYADHYERFHLVLDSEVSTTFYCDGESVEMRPGEVWWFNHKLEHWVINPTTQSRTHLIVDAVAPKYRRERHAVSA